MQRQAQLRMLRMVLIVLALGLSAQAETLAGTILDPQQRVIVGATVSLNCAGRTQSGLTDAHGQFRFARPTLPPACLLRASYPGFATYEMKLGTARNLTLQLKVAILQQAATVQDELPPMAPLGSVSLSHDELNAVSDDTRDLLAYAKSLAGINAGADHIYVNGLPSNTLPPAQAIERITINGDPFSAEYDDGSDNHIEILTRNVDRNFRVRFGGTSLAMGGQNALDSRLGSAQKSGRLELTGPVPGLPVSFSADGDGFDRHNQVALEATAPASLPGASPAAPPTAANSNVTANLGAYYVRDASLHVTGNFYDSTVSQSNMNVQGWTLPQAGSGENAGTREYRASLSQTGPNHIDRGGLVINSADTRITANSTTLGVNVPGAFTAGGAYLSVQGIQSRGWLVKNVLESSWRGHLWSLGATVSETANSQLEVPNPAGMVQFPTLADYLASTNSGAATDTWLVTRGNGRAAYSSRAAAPFAEGEIIRRKQVLLRAGLRWDYQTDGGMVTSPRLSAATGVRGFVVRLGSGRFVQNWSNGTFMAVVANDGTHLRQYLANNVSLSGLGGGGLTAATPIVAEMAPGLERPCDWISKISVQRALAHGLVPAIEYTRTTGTHLLGSRRLSAAIGWNDVLESNRSSDTHEVRFRTTYKLKGQGLTGNYDWIRAYDNTDGPFSFPANQNDIRAEWGRSSGISPHNISLVANLHLPKAVALSLVEAWHSAAPLNLTTGLEQSNGLFTSRGGLPRNSGDGPAYHSLDLYATHKIALPRFLAGSKHKASMDIGLQGQNLLGNKNYSSMGTILGSPLFGQPLAALPGRSIRISANFER